tara:strand:+ start:17116 stop:18171 length:1056 start_codon:yes stop_codon:yes gene_type:complete
MGKSGLGKEFPVNLAKELVMQANVTRVIAGRSSIQAIIQELGTSRSREGTSPILDARGFIVNGELSTAVIQDPDSLTVLTDLYDNKSSWTNLLKGDGPKILKNPYITCLFGSSPAHFYESVPQVNIEGGYIGRNLLVFEERRARETDLLDDTGDDVVGFPYDKFIPHLVKIANGNGRIIPNNSAKEYFNAWRKKWRAQPDEDKTGFANRVPAHILKAAMCLCVAEYDSKLVITREHMEEAVEKIVGLTYANKRAVEGKGTEPLAAQIKMVLDFLLQADGHELKRKQLLTKGYGAYDSLALDRSIENLIEMGWVKTERFIAGKATDTIVMLTGEPLEQYKRFIDERAKGKQA